MDFTKMYMKDAVGNVPNERQEIQKIKVATVSFGVCLRSKFATKCLDYFGTPNNSKPPIFLSLPECNGDLLRTVMLCWSRMYSNFYLWIGRHTR